MQKIDQIREVYEKIQNEFLNNPKTFNDKSFRKNLIKRLESEIEDVNVKCDEENNFSEVIDMNCIVATLTWQYPKQPTYQYQYCYLVFGPNDEAIYQIHQHFTTK